MLLSKLCHYITVHNHRTDYIELEDASYYGKSNGELETPVFISVFKLKNKDQKSITTYHLRIM